MPVSNPNKTVSRTALDCDGTTLVTLSFEAAPQLETVPADIILMMDRSGSMNGAPLVFAKEAAREFIEIMAKASGDLPGESLSNGSQMALVSFADTAATDQGLTTDVAALDSAVNGLVSSGLTNHKEAFELAGTLLAGSTAQRQVVIMFTDGKTTTGGSADAAAEALKRTGVEVFCIGLGTDLTPLEQWASDPASIHVSSTDNVGRLMQVFEQAAAEVVRAGALDALVREVLSDDFKLMGVESVSHGTVEVLNPRTLDWTIPAAGAAGPERVELTFRAAHVGTADGRKPVNQTVTYTDREANQLAFPNPEVEVTCAGTVIFPEDCPLPATFLMDSCQDAAVMEANDTYLSGLGRIVQVDAVVKNVCPGRKVAAAVLLTELGGDGVEHARGTKTILIPAQTGTECRDIQLKCISFVVPEELDVAGSPDSICDPRGFRARVLANYVDTDFVCCDPQTVIL